MCEPVSIALAVGAVASGLATASSANRQSKIARRQAIEQQQYNEEAKASALANQENQLAAIVARRFEERDAASDEIQRASLESARQAATAKVSSAESGVAGLSVDALIGDIYSQAGLSNVNSIRNQNSVQDQLSRQEQSIRSNTLSTINGLRGGQSYTTPDYLGIGLSTAGQVAGAVGGIPTGGSKAPRTSSSNNFVPTPVLRPNR